MCLKSHYKVDPLLEFNSLKVAMDKLLKECWFPKP
jgi:hypothetical protein